MTQKKTICIVPQKYICYGSVSLISCNPFRIKRSDKCNIIKFYNNSQE